jgi:outer membrane protein assembly factor BamB
MRSFSYSAAALILCISTVAIVRAQSNSSCAATAGNSGMNCSAPELCCSGAMPQCYQPSQSQCCQWDQADGLCAAGEVCCGAGRAGTAFVACCQSSWQCCNLPGSSSVSCCPPNTTCCGVNPTQCCNNAYEVCDAETSTCKVFPTPAPPTPPPVPNATYAWVTENTWLSDATQTSPLVRGDVVIVPVANSTLVGVAALNATTGAVLWNYTVSAQGYPWIPREGRNAYLICSGSFIAIDVTTGKPAWEYNPGGMNENYPVLLTASENIVAVSNASGVIEVRNATTGQLLVTRLNEQSLVADGGRDTVFLNSAPAAVVGADVQRIDLRSNKTLWNATIAAPQVGLWAMQVDWQRGELLMTGAVYVAVLNVETGTLKNMVSNKSIGSAGVVLPRAPGATDSLIAIAWASLNLSSNSVCALNISTLQCAWETFNSTCGSSGPGDWLPATTITYVGADVIVTIGSGRNCLTGYSAIDGTLLWTTNSSIYDNLLSTPVSFTGPGNATTIVSLSTFTQVVVTVDATTGAMNQLQGSANLVKIGVTESGLIVGLGAGHVYGIRP